MSRSTQWMLCGVLLLPLGCQKGAEKRAEKGAPESKGAEKGAMESKGAPTMRARPSARVAPPRRAVTPPQAGPRAVQVWSAGGLKVPESVQHDPVAGVLYVSCINGKPTEKNGKGYLAKLSLDGKIVAAEWVRGLNAPKGMGLHGRTLYVTDIDRLHAVDTGTGRIRWTIAVPEAKFLNDIAVHPDGRVFVSDMVTGQVHVLRGKKLRPFADLRKLKGANGMLMQGQTLLVGTATGIARVDLTSRQASLLVPVGGFGMIDGLKAYDATSYLMSNWKGRTQLVDRQGRVTVLLDTTARKIQSADLEYVPAKRLLLIPTFFDNRVVAYRIER